MIEQLKKCKNSLTKAATDIAPTIFKALKMIEEQDGCHLSRMSGSGATCFGIFKDEISARRACDSITNNYPEWWVVQTRLL